jgi:hypothetical protein
MTSFSLKSQYVPYRFNQFQFIPCRSKTMDGCMDRSLFNDSVSTAEIL